MSRLKATITVVYEDDDYDQDGVHVDWEGTARKSLEFFDIEIQEVEVKVEAA